MTSKTHSNSITKIREGLCDMRRKEVVLYKPQRCAHGPESFLDIVLNFVHKFFGNLRLFLVLLIDIPDAYCYLQAYLDLIEALVELEGDDKLDEAKEIRSDLKVSALYFMQDIPLWHDVAPSVVAYAVMLVSLEDYAGDRVREEFTRSLFEMTGIDKNAPGLYETLSLISDPYTADSICMGQARSQQSHDVKTTISRVSVARRFFDVSRNAGLSRRRAR